MPYQNEVRPLNLFGDFLAGRQAAGAEQEARQMNALRGMQLQRAQGLNALAQDPQATPEQYIRAGDAATGAALYSNQQAQSTDKQQALGQLAGLAQKALTIQDPAQRKAFLAQAAPAYADAFTAIGADHGKGLAELQQLPDGELQQRLQQVAQFAAPEKPIEVSKGASLVTRQPGGGYQATYTAPADPAKPMDPLGQLNADFKSGLMSQEDYNSRRTLLTTRQNGSAAAGGFDDPKIQDLQAAISAAGYSLPAGFRSQAQQLALMRGLLRKYNGLAPDDIAHLLASNAIDYKSITKATQTAATIVGKVEVANNELQAFVPIARDASALVDRGTFVPWNRLKQMGETSISDPNLKRLYVATQSILNAYDMLAARGGTDQDKRAHNRAILSSADSPEAYNAALDMIVTEGQAAGAAARASTKSSAYDGTGHSATPQSSPVRVKSPQEAMALAPGTVFITPDGRQKVR